MDLFSKITISHFIWYLVPGLGFILFLFFPLLVFKPELTKLLFETVGPFGIIILGTILGFLLDGLRLYRFRPNYSKIREAFFSQLKSIINPALNPYFIQSHVDDVARSKSVTGLSFHHAIWIMLGQFTILGFLEAFFWILSTIYFYHYKATEYSFFGASVSGDTAIIFCGSFSVLFLLISWRFLYTSIQDQETTNNMFLDFARQHCDEIRRLLNDLSRDKNTNIHV
ncbi:MAG TPA: hypothetical protein DCE80_07435 [Ignavibacteriales bacterium]|nr:hypothetical protein [Ignavibacteriales bacterium]